jgi:GNAT superfamily N-acetyltransferase
MLFREAVSADILQIQRVRNAVKENRLSDPSLVPDADVEDYINNRGKGWVCIKDDRIVGFAIADLVAKNIWALFVDPPYEALGIGKALHQLMLNWYFNNTDETVWLSTAPGSRAEKFYRLQGWTESGIYGKGEVKFEMTVSEWKKKIHN